MQRLERILIESLIAETFNRETPHSRETISSPFDESISHAEDSADRAVFVLYIHVAEKEKARGIVIL